MPETIGYFDFIVIKHHQDYLNFAITFSFGKHFCEVTGMGWQTEKKVHYYISNIIMNKQHATFEEAKEVGIAMVQDSAVFEYLQLDHLAKSYIKAKLAKP
ncbi:hypothetical protein [Candidatus Methylopumilus turicensis]|uniref:Uncharacterized protein n=1 Tax=Candidatus Methylopumilus turicensis TaxID=1581680 RepID=A0A0B7ITG7_9PROT|nr:hypothetical protein [Candidatus Methylopumilus turicensis]CEN55553.1 protein of unknown function [Candidatus Methylopumilus turicensis]